MIYIEGRVAKHFDRWWQNCLIADILLDFCNFMFNLGVFDLCCMVRKLLSKKDDRQLKSIKGTIFVRKGALVDILQPNGMTIGF